MYWLASKGDLVPTIDLPRHTLFDREDVEALSPDLVVVDGLIKAMNMQGLKYDNNDDMATMFNSERLSGVS